MVWVGDDSGLHWGGSSKDEEKWIEFKTYLKVEPERLVGRLDEVGKLFLCLTLCIMCDENIIRDF